MVERITSRTNPLMTHIRKLSSSRSYRREHGEYLGDGTKLLEGRALAPPRMARGLSRQAFEHIFCWFLVLLFV